jgi:hypothetical protein
MIEIASYRISLKPLSFTNDDWKDQKAVTARIEAYQQSVVDFVKAQAEAYQMVGDGYSLGGDRGDAHLSVTLDPDSRYALHVSSTGGFEKFLKQSAQDSIVAIEEPCGTQFMVLAGFVPSAYQSNMGGYGGNGSLRAPEFNRISHGVAPGRALTEAEKEARVAMNDAVFEKLSAALREYKANDKDVVVEVQEKQLGSFFVRVTPKDPHQQSVQDYFLSTALDRLARDKENVAALLRGPALYPTDVEKLRAPKDTGPQTPPPRKPKTLDL